MFNRDDSPLPITCMIIDSVWADFPDLCWYLAIEQNKYPKELYKMMYDNVIERVQEMTGGLDLSKMLNTEKFAPNWTIPALFTHSREDKVVPIEHGQRVYDAYGGPK